MKCSYVGVVIMQTIKQESLALYQWNKNKIPTWMLCVGVTLIALCVFGIGILLMRTHITSGAGIDFFVLGFFGTVFAPIWLAATRRDRAKKIDADCGCQLLKRWEQYANRYAKEFPMSDIQRRLNVGWAKTRLRDLAVALNCLYADQESLLKHIQDIGEKDDLCESDRKTCNEMYERACREVEAAKAMYLGNWNVLTDGEKDDGSGLLRGDEWRDPEVFRQKVLKGKVEPRQDWSTSE